MARYVVFNLVINFQPKDKVERDIYFYNARNNYRKYLSKTFENKPHFNVVEIAK